jgi:hypothetical protein
MWTFCKTENKPYDVVVTAILIAQQFDPWTPPRAPFEVTGAGTTGPPGRTCSRGRCGPLTEDEKIALELDVEAMQPTPAEQETLPPDQIKNLRIEGS